MADTNGSELWPKLGKAAFKFATNDKVMKAGAFMGKLTYLRMTNPLIYVGLEAVNSARDAIIMNTISGKKSTGGDFVKDAIGMAGFGYVMDNAMLMGVQALGRSQYGSSLAGDAVDAILSKVTKGAIVPKEGMVTVGDLVAQSMRKFIKPVDLGPWKFGAVGAAAGLLYAGLNDKKDGVRGTAFDMISGAGLVMLGHEMYHHLKKGAEKEEKSTIKGSVNKAIGKVKKADSGYLGFEAMDELLGTKSGQEMKNALNGLLKNTDEGKYLQSFFTDIMNGNLKGLASIATDSKEIMKNVQGFRQHVEDYIKTPGGRKNYIKFAEQAVDSVGKYGPDFKDSILKDANRMIDKHIDGIKNGVKTAQEAYVQNQELIQTMLKRAGFTDKDITSVHTGMTDGLTKTIKGLDDITSKEVVDGPKTKDVTESTVGIKESEVKASPQDTKKQSEDIAHNKANTEQTTASDLEQQLAKEKHIASQKMIASQRRITNWKEKGKVVGAIGLGAFAVATAIDISERLDHRTDTSKMVNEEKHSQAKKQHNMEKKYHQQAYGHIDMGQMVTQMFQDRIGHHNMGNAKFNPNQYMIQGQTYTI